MDCFEIEFEFRVFLWPDCTIEIFGSVFDLFKFTLADLGLIEVLVVFELLADRGESA